MYAIYSHNSHKQEQGSANDPPDHHAATAGPTAGNQRTAKEEKKKLRLASSESAGHEVIIPRAIPTAGNRSTTAEKEEKKKLHLAPPPSASHNTFVFAINSTTGTNQPPRRVPPRVQAPGAVAVAGINHANDYDSLGEQGDEILDIEPGQAPSNVDQHTDVVLEAERAPTEEEMKDRWIADLPVAKLAPSHKKWWLLGLFGVLLLAGLAVGLGIAFKPDPPRPVFQADACIEVEANYSYCFKEGGFPLQSLSTVFEGCPSTNEEGILQCQGQCVIVQIDDVNDFVDGVTPSCNGCMICGDEFDPVAYDCTNLLPADPCAFRDCNGECHGSRPPPSPPSSETQADECAHDKDDGSFYCQKLDIPAELLFTQFQYCDEESGEDNVYTCSMCVVVTEDHWNDTDSDTKLCSGCIICGDSIMYDCSNVFPDDPCAVKNCDGECIG